MQVACRPLEVTDSGYYAWRVGSAGRPQPGGNADGEVVPGLVELEVAVPPLETCLW